MAFFLRALVFLLLSVSCAVSAELVTPSERVRTVLNVRSAPDTSAALVGRLAPGQTAELIARVPLWYRVRLPDGTEGFASKAWSTVVEEGPALAGLLAKRPEELRVHFFNIGAGSCTLVECPGANARPIVVDCGSFPGTIDRTTDTVDDLKTSFQAFSPTTS